jgi:hypothetical protein
LCCFHSSTCAKPPLLQHLQLHLRTLPHTHPVWWLQLVMHTHLLRLLLLLLQLLPRPLTALLLHLLLLLPPFEPLSLVLPGLRGLLYPALYVCQLCVSCCCDRGGV